MISIEILGMVTVITFVVGALLGAVISRTLFPPEQKKALEQNLTVARAELEKYQQDVSKHFAETSKLVSGLTQSYKDVHEHLAKGAVELTNAEVSQQMFAAGDESLGIEGHEELKVSSVEAPRDWAPKSPGSLGTLSEEYGLAEHDEDLDHNKEVSNK